ncbi:hypothetical protein SteCoe_31743 [Stentor coeruleus]|uniref:Uncharacterized protein n=1 Tax=Stentor coeruleus TaxID=5963 RepID=A0A1R2B113_9CILI|nr:hypothetical protein SteCoe_31743 [Stentor coeruleus]
MFDTLSQGFIIRNEGDTQSISISKKPIAKTDNFRTDEAQRELRKVWKYIQIEPSINLSHSYSTTLNYHTGSVLCVSFSPDGNYLASVSEDKQIIIWDLINNKEHFSFNNTSLFFSVIFSPNSNLLATGSSDSTISLWSISEKVIIHTFTSHEGNVTTLSFSPDGNFLASGSSDELIKIWSLSEKALEFTLAGHKNSIFNICFSPDGKFLASGSSDSTIKIWNFDNKNEEFTLIGHNGIVCCVVFSRNGKYLASSSEDNLIKVWDFAEKIEKFTLEGHTNWVNSIAFSPNNELLASGSSDKLIKIWSFAEQKEKCTLAGHTNWVRSVKFSEDGNFLASGSSDSLIKIWKLGEKDQKFSFSEHKNPVKCLKYSPNGMLLACGYENGTINIWNAIENTIKCLLKGHSDSVCSIDFIQQCQYLASGSADSTIKVWSILEEIELFTFIGHKSCVNSVNFSSEGFLASGSSDKLIKIWDFGEKKLKFTLIGHNDIVKSVNFSPDGKFLASGSLDSHIKVWNLAESKEEYTLIGPATWVNSISFSPDGRFLAAGSYDFTIKIWNLADKKVEFALKGHQDAVSCVSFSMDGRYLASGSYDKTIKLWNLPEKCEERTIKGHEGWVNCLSFSPNGEFLASGSDDFSVKIWDFSKEKQKFWFLNRDLPIKNVSLSLSGQYLAFEGNDKEIAIWDLYEKNEICKIFGINERVETMDFNLDTKIIYIKTYSGVKGYSMNNGIEVSIESLIGNTKKSSKNLFDPITCTTSYYQNYFKTIENFYHLTTKSFEKLNSLNATFTNLNFSIAHMMSMLGNEITIEKFINSKKLIISTDIFGHGPAYYSIKSHNQKVTDLLISYMSDLLEDEPNSYNSYLSLKTLEHDLVDLLKNASSYIDKLLSWTFIQQDKSVCFNSPLTSLPIVKISDYHLSYISDFSNSQGTSLPLIIKQIPFRLPLSTGTSSSLQLLSAITECRNKDIYRTSLIQQLTTYKWNRILLLVYLITFLIWGNIIALSIYISTKSYIFGSIAFLINIMLIFWEAMQFSITGLAYFRSISNILDLLRFYLTAVYGFFTIFDIQNTTLLWTMMTLNLIKGFSGFKAFGNTRYYIKLLEMCIIRMKDFLIIFIYATISLGIMNAISSQEDLTTYQSIWSSPFGIIVGKTDPFYETNNIQIITYILAVTTNMIIMLNMIISILGDVFDEFQLDAEIFDYSEMAEVVYEIEQIMTFMNNIEEFKYLHICMHAYENTDNGWKGKMIDIRDFIKGTFFNYYIKPLFEENKEMIRMNDEKVEKGFKDIKEEVEKIFNNVDEKVDKMNERVVGMQDKMEEFKSKVEEVEGKVDRIHGNIEMILALLTK